MRRKPIAAAGLKLIKRFEGLRLVGYPDATGIPTNGYGHTGADVYIGQRITEKQAEQWLLEDLQDSLDAVDRLVEVPINRFQRAALASFAFNAGAGALEDSTLLRKLNNRRYRSVPKQLMRWVHAGSAVLQGLVRRRSAEGRLWSRHPKTKRPKRTRRRRP